MSGSADPISLAVVLALLALVPLAAVMTTSFLKIAVVLTLVRNALGVQQVPPNMALYGLALILSAYVMGPVVMQIGDELRTPPAAVAPGAPAADRLEGIMDAVARGAEPMRAFMLKNSRPEQRDFFVRTARELWGEQAARNLKEDDLLVLIPSFLVSELTAAFQIGFLLYLPFVIIDLIVSNILLAMGMMMVSPVTISMPLKLFLFVMVDGWTRLIQGLVLSYG
ncbi:EscR/YscR/HrcR family type III secretion system export apparatus protein [Achromobacter denitrificans]|jgi:type III secretion protein R|uniref:Type III secretion system export apparatus subunit SctR n=1 Tax=Achromobacter denitrificans TaxID=32002 RepID=A0A6N0JRD9_ACHDE|nr:MULTISPECIES: type III secretion system export apparatus subunit SctR [Achromobacter]ASC64045.1 EscR/YscR/HrcR family type III secretion system export apparatus protein [Achromobacter denitrificans]MBV2158274.1 type III secretion system export apparatus subunit SctR [Achromobacter denitrificans]MDF3848473.1 type III secretion system export apparatus subunit SctR [Achromobacter denitrificans]MDF3861852.1 type III secretion system export apparatus subunit SctR [Achromobacter denitrificans]MDF